MIRIYHTKFEQIINYNSVAFAGWILHFKLMKRYFICIVIVYSITALSASSQSINKIQIDVNKQSLGGKLHQATVKVEGLEDIILKLGLDISDQKNKWDTQFIKRDNAVAFRYKGNNNHPLVIKNELSEWILPANTKVWYFERLNSWKLKSYAGTWMSCALKDFHKASKLPIQGLPLIFEFTNGSYALLTEVGLTGYSGMRIKVGIQGELSANFTEKNGFKVNKKFISPWRVLYFAKDLNELVNQNIVQQLSPKPDRKLYRDMSYIVPGMCAWRWFAKGTGTPTQEKEMIDHASKINFKYTMVDDGWHKWPNPWGEIKDLADYGRDKNVGVIVWKHSHEIMDTENDYQQMKEWLDNVQKSGCVGIKVDFMDSESKEIIDFDLKLLKESAKRKLLVIFHGCQKPSGEQYTYPNEITREGIRGVELNKMREGYVTAANNAALPFTRFVVGNGDYTPLTFTVPGETAFAHQLATIVCFTSAIQVIAEDPELLLTNSYVTPALELIKKMPTVWDETRVLEPSVIGELAVIARRKDSKWYVGILNGESKEKVIKLDLTALKITGKPELKLYMDNIDVEKVLLSMDGYRPAYMKREPSIPFKVKELPYSSNLILKIAPNGGCVIEIFN